MEIGEKVAPKPKFGKEKEGGCPFDHEPKPEDDKTENELAGDSGALRKNMTDGKGVGIHSHQTCKKTADPRSEGRGTVVLKVLGKVVELNRKPLPYPLVCAAHHLIPAQQALRGHPLLDFMCRPDKPQTFLKNGTKVEQNLASSKVWANVGYNVNGGQNGVWSPGNYGVGGGAAGVAVWKKRESDMPKKGMAEATNTWVKALIDLSADEWAPTTDSEENDVPSEAALAEAVAEALKDANLQDYALSGTNFRISTDNPKWAYVKAAMDKTGVQFHDSHKDYSEWVAKYLDKLEVAYTNMYNGSTEGKCDECMEAKRPKGVRKSRKLVGPPKDLVARLIRCSAYFRRHLAPRGERITMNIYTSNWVKKWIEAERPRLQKGWMVK